MSTVFSFRIGQEHLQAVLASMERVLEEHPELEGKLALEVVTDLIPDGMSYEISNAEVSIVAEGHTEPVKRLEQVSFEEITQQEGIAQ